MGFWKTVLSGIVVFVVVKILEAYAPDMPTWLQWLGNGATWLWAKLWAFQSIPFAAVLVFALLLVQLMYLVVQRSKEVLELTRKLYPERPQLSEDEMNVLDALSHLDQQVEMDLLLNITGLTRLRLSHAVAELRLKGFVSQNIDNDVSLAYQGSKYIIENNLD